MWWPYTLNPGWWPCPLSPGINSVAHLLEAKRWQLVTLHVPRLCSLGLWWQWELCWLLNHLEGHSSLFLKDIHSQIALLACFLAGEPQKPSLPSFLFPASALFIPSWQCFCWDGWLDLQVTCLIILATGSPTPHLVPFPEYISLFVIWIGWKFSKSSCYSSFLLTIPSSNSLFPLAFYYKH